MDTYMKVKCALEHCIDRHPEEWWNFCRKVQTSLHLVENPSSFLDLNSDRARAERANFAKAKEALFSGSGPKELSIKHRFEGEVSRLNVFMFLLN